jgi:hypothetical protein
VRTISYTFQHCLLESACSVRENASPEKGWRDLNSGLSSIIGHPLGIPLVLLLDFLNDELDGPVTPSSKKKVDKFQAYLNDGCDMSYLGSGNNLVKDARIAKDRSSKLSSELAKTVERWYKNEKGETNLTADITNSFGTSPVMRQTVPALLEKDEETKGYKPLQSTGEIQIDDLQTGGRYDIALADMATKAPVALFEVGLINSEWWGKLDQALGYVKILPNLEYPIIRDNEVILTKLDSNPMIMCVLTLDQKKSQDKKKLDKKSDGDSFKIAAFLCWQELTGNNKNKNVFSALLWRKQGTNVVKSASKAVANVAVAAMWLQENSGKPIPQDTFCVMGPNCSRIKDKVCLQLLLGIVVAVVS